MSRLLVCPPDYFGIEYEINPWMRVSNAADHELAQRQWQNLMHELEVMIGVRLERMTPLQGLPDMVFTANAGVVHKGRAVLSRFRHPERQREEQHFEAWFQTQGYAVTSLKDGIHFEGAGDLLGFSELWFGGYRQRTDIRAYAQIGEIFGQEIIPLELVDSRFYHLDTCFCPLSGGELLYYPNAFDPYARTVIESRIDKRQRVIVQEAEALRFACNAVCVNRHVVLPDGCPETARQLKDHGYEVHPIPLDEFMKAGGSAKCLTLALE